MATENEAEREDLGLTGPRGRVLLALMMATGLAALDATILATALPAVVADLGDYAQFPWLFSIFLLAQAVTVPLYGKLADQVGRKPLLVFGILLFVVASALSALAGSMPVLILGRALQGLGAGAILPMAMTVVGDLYTVRERGRIQGYLASVWAISSVVGPALGGIFSTWASWRWIFWLNVPLGGAALLLLRSFRETVERRESRLDLAGAATLALSLSALLLGLLEGGRSWAWDSATSLFLFASGAFLLALFVFVETRAPEPVVPLWVFSRRLLATTSLVAAGSGAVLLGVTSYVPDDLMRSRDLAPLQAGAAVAALSLGWPLATTLSAKMYLRIGFRRTALVGTFLVAASTLGMALASGDPSLSVFAPLCFVAGLGFGFAATPTLVAAQASVAWERRGVVTGGNQFSRAVGSAVGVATLGALANASLVRLPGGEAVPRNIVAATRPVLWAVFAIAALALAAAWAMPEDAPLDRT